MNIKLMTIAVAACGLIFATGCTTKMGVTNPSANFVYPNSNVESLGPVSASKSKLRLLIPPAIGIEDMKGVKQEALAQQSGADVLINVKEDTTFTSFFILPIYSIKYDIEAEAANMTVGKQYLK